MSEDLNRDGTNWFVYCYSRPTAHTDRTGSNPIDKWVQIRAILIFAYLALSAWETMDMEAAYGDLMAAMNYSFWVDTVGVQEGVGDFMSIFPSTFLVMIGARFGGLIGALIGTALMIADYAGRAGGAVAKLAIITAAYGIRLQWYVDQID